MFKKIKFILLTCFIIGLLSSCSSLSYYTQSVLGHSALMLSRKPIDEVINSAEKPLKTRLQTAVEIRRYASGQLALPENKSYSSYVQLKNDPPIWNVIAAEEFSLRAKQWCYLVIGCASYRGYYHKEDAERHAAKLREQGYEVYLSGATAYSTLGWFDDPLTSAMFKRGDANLAELIFHELAHQQLYIKGDSRFNEAFASTVGEQGAKLWLEETNQAALLKRYKVSLSVRDDFINLVNQTKAHLTELYDSQLSEEEKRTAKAKIFDEMKRNYQNIKKNKWGNKNWYSNWFSQPINNARLVAIATYRDLVPDFTRLFERCNKNFMRFYQQVEKISKETGRDLNVRCESV